LNNVKHVILGFKLSIKLSIPYWTIYIDAIKLSYNTIWITMVNEEDHDEELYWGIVNSIINDKRVCTHPYLRRVSSERAFRLKRNHDEVLSECHLLEELKGAIENAPEEAILFHLDGRNDFATWVREEIGDLELGADLERIRPSKTIDVRSELVHVLDSRIKALRYDSVNLIFD